MKHIEDGSTTIRVLERDVVYSMKRWNSVSAKGWPEGREPTAGDFADRHWEVTESKVEVEMQIMDLAPRVFLDCPTPYPEWYLLNGAVYSAPAFYRYVRAFYPPSGIDKGEWITNHFRKLADAY